LLAVLATAATILIHALWQIGHSVKLVGFKVPRFVWNATALSIESSWLVRSLVEKEAALHGENDAERARGYDKPTMQEACDQMFPFSIREDRSYLSFGEVWDELAPSILNATYHHYPRSHRVDYARADIYRRWVDHLFGYFNSQQLKRSQAHPAPTQSVRRILEVIQKRIRDPVNNEPLRILVMGGSVTAGRDCEVNPLGLPGSKVSAETQRWCSYTSRLEFLLNSVLFPSKRPIGGVRVRNGRYDGSTTRAMTAAAASDDLQGAEEYYPVFEVTNVATQATNSQVGAMALEYWLLPFLEHEPPHVVISSYSANDAWDDEVDAFEVYQQDWVRAARNLRPCDDHLPLLVLADDVFSHDNFLSIALTQTGSLYKTASWYDAMAVTYSNVVRHVSDYSSNFSDADGHPLYGSGRDSLNHLGMGFHMGQSWTLFYNLAEAMHATCTEPLLRDKCSLIKRIAAPSSAALTEERTKECEDHTAKNRFRSIVEPRTKYRGRYRSNATLVLKDWARNEAIKALRCSDRGRIYSTTATGDGAVPRSEFSTRTCVYAWMANQMTPVWTQEDVARAMKRVVMENDGWIAVDRPKAGWYTNGGTSSAGNNSSFFSIEMRNISADASHITILSLKSYGSQWEGSRIRIVVEVEASTNDAVPSRRSAEYYVDGYHNKSISVSYPHRFRLPGVREDSGVVGGARAGDTVRAQFTNVGAAQFKISGLAICELAMSEEP
jgi:hypothetical protein